MSNDELLLLIETARAVASLMDDKAQEIGQTNNHSEEIKKLIEKVNPQSKSNRGVPW